MKHIWKKQVSECHPEVKPKDPTRFLGRFLRQAQDNVFASLRMTGLLLSALLLLTHCGGNSFGDGGSNKPLKFTSGSPPDPTTDISTWAQNTFLSQGIQITVTPTYVDMGKTTQGKAITASFTLTNGTTEARDFTLNLVETTGSFGLVDDQDKTSAFQSLRIETGQSRKITLRFDASSLGTKTGYVDIKAIGLSGMIRFSFRAGVSETTDFKIIPLGYLCSNSKAPQIDKIDFMRVASGQAAKQSVKICNAGGGPLQINTLSFSANSTGAQSEAVTPNVLADLSDDGNDMLDTTYFNYYNPDSEPFVEPSPEKYNGSPSPAEVLSSFNAYAFKEGVSVVLKNLVIPADDYVVLTVSFINHLDAEASEGRRLEAVPYSAQMNISTSVGVETIDVVGASGGREPVLKILAAGEGEPLPDCNDQNPVDIESSHGSIKFPPASVYPGWIPEDITRMVLRICNVGSSSKTNPLLIWGDDIRSGYFTYFEESPPKKFPLSVTQEEPQTIIMEYIPTPKGGTASENFDVGSVVFRHNGSNGPANRINMIGEQKTSSIIQLTQNQGLVKPIPSDSNQQPPYSPTKRKNLFCAQIAPPNQKEPQVTEKEFILINNSKNYRLASTLTLKKNQLTDNNEKDIDAWAETDPSSFATEPKGRNSFKLKIKLGSSVPAGTQIIGRLGVANTFDVKQAGGRAPQYDIYFKVVASETAECRGVAGDAPDGEAYMIVDRITMNLLKLFEPARNPPPFKFQMPIVLSKANGSVKIKALDYDPEKNLKPHEQIRSYAHQVTNQSQGGCFPLPTNPYKLEFEAGSWDGPYQCDYAPQDKPWLKVVGSAACMDSNGAQEAEWLNLATNQKEKVSVFYHEFAKFGPNCGTPQIEGRYSTFFLRKDEKPKDVFTRMLAEVGENGEEDDYARYTLPYSFGSSIKFNVKYPFTANPNSNCKHEAGDEITDANAIRDCWSEFRTDPQMVRAYGFVDECSYFQFEIEEGCDINNADDMKRPDCKDVVVGDSKTWKGYGEYEQDSEDHTKWHITMRNTHIRAYTLVHSYAGIFSHKAKVLYSDLYVTLTTKTVGKEYENNTNPYDDHWNDLLAEKSKEDFTEDMVIRPLDKTATDYWVNDGVNGFYAVGEDGNFDDVPCDPKKDILEHCRGNYELTDNHLLHAGEPIDLESNNRGLLVGLSGFRGKGQTAPEFAREEGGKGQPLYFTFHGCIKEAEKDADGKPKPLDADAGCYNVKKDDAKWHGRDITDVYQDPAIGLLKPEDVEEPDLESPDPNKRRPKAWINFKIFDEDRNRLTNYYNTADPFRFDDHSLAGGRPCGYGM